MTEIAGWERLISNLGAPVAIISLLVLAVAKWGPPIARRVADWIERLVGAHLEFIATARDQGERSAQALESVKVALADKLDPEGDPKYRDHLFSTFRTNRALAYMADAMMAAAEEQGEACARAVRPHFEAIKKALLSREE